MSAGREPIRAGLLTAATVMLLALPSGASAQPAPTAHPTGGQVVAGTATIGQSATITTINQSSQRAATTWNSFDVGAQMTVRVSAPNQSAVTLMRVTGPDPSLVAGHIVSNGIVVITNASGAELDQGAQVNAKSFILFAPGITTKNFIAGRMTFDRPPKPDAMITNAGTITTQPGGMTAVMAPAIRSQGIVNGRLGSVELLGGLAGTINLGTVASAHITKSVARAPLGPDGKPVAALITQSGTITAPAGSIVIDAAALNGIVQRLSSNSGLLAANTTGSRTGSIHVVGVGGSVAVGGKVQAMGGGKQRGGTIVVNPSGSVTITARGRVNASGGAGGGTISVGTPAGTSAANGFPAGTSRSVKIPAGAVLAASATRNGNGGRIVALSTQSLVFAGQASVTGGPAAGNGGSIELSTRGTLTMTGTTDVSAPNGHAGAVVLDPRRLIL